MSKQQILLVEDDVNFGSVLRSFLEMNDLDVTLVDDGLNAVSTFKAGQFLGLDSYYMFYTPIYTDGTTDEDGYLVAFPGDYTLTFDPETGIYSNLDETKYSAYGLVDGSLKS